MSSKVAYDTATPALRKLVAGFKSTGMITKVAGDVRAVITSRTLSGTSLTGGGFNSYSDGGTYYASVKSRTPGYPSPKGGRTTALRGGRKLKSMAFDEGYSSYKSKQGWGSSPQLSVSGQMLGDMQIRVLSARKAEIYFPNRLHEAKAHGLHTGKFPFFGLTRTEQNNLSQALVSYLRKQGVN